ncbi:hypothetical protein TNCV_3070641 [Trichonephila clavipes]|nr:hypothetical protein TNCV_3070641 [Trichonephila clavipes]
MQIPDDIKAYGIILPYFQTNANSAQHSCSNETISHHDSFIHLSVTSSSLVPNVPTFIRHESNIPFENPQCAPVLSGRIPDETSVSSTFPESTLRS